MGEQGSRVLKLYLISQSENGGYDTFDSAVVAAPDEETARQVKPGGDGELMTVAEWKERWSSWCNGPEHVTVKYLGVADATITETSVICASFNAG